MERYRLKSPIILLINSIIGLSWLTVVVIALILIASIYNKLNNNEEKEVLICGTIEIGDSGNKQDSLMRNGKELFKLNCRSCHIPNMKDDMTGPALFGITKRWSQYPKEDLYKWIRNSQSLILDNHPRAILIWNQWDRVMMDSFPKLTDSDIESIITYIEREY